MPERKYNAFISYSHQDGECFALELKQKITNDPRGNEILFWQDYDNMQYGQWSRQIEEAINAVEFLIMIITPRALLSPNCKDEWMYARREGVCILPVNGLPDHPAFFDEFPAWLKKQHVYNLNKQWERFINDLNTTPKRYKIPFMAPRLSEVENYVERKEKYADLKGLLLNTAGERNISITTALQGAGGFGKTTLAIALCNDDEIIHAFDEGILWVTLGQQQGTAQSALQKLYQGFTDETGAFVDLEQAQQKVSEKLGKRNCLVVIDDVWHRVDVENIIKSLSGCTTLITTRFDKIVARSRIHPVFVDEMQEQEGLDLLTASFKDLVDDLSLFKDLAKKLGYWPLLMKLAAGQLNNRIIDEGETPSDALIYMVKKFERLGLVAFDLEDANQRNDSVKKCLEASIDLIKAEDKPKLLQLGIFPENAEIPYHIAGKLWGLDEFNTEELLLKFHRLGLIDLDFPGKSIKIHDVSLRYYSEILPYPKQVHSCLLDRLGHFREFNSLYEWRYHMWHLQQAGEKEKCIKLLLDFEWIEAKLFATDINQVLHDYEYFPSDENCNLVYKALKLSSHVLAGDKGQLAAQIFGRLAYFENHTIKSLVEKADKWQNKNVKWLKSIKPTLQPPGYLQRIFKGHLAYVNGALIYQDKMVSWSADRTLRIWDVGSGNSLHVLQGHSSYINGALIHREKLISWSDDCTLRIWDIRSGSCLHILQGHLSYINGALIHQDKLISWSDDRTLRIWDIESGNSLHVLHGHSATVYGALIYRDKMISWSADRTLRIWDVASGNILHVLQGHSSYIYGALIHQDRMISWSYDSTLRIWDIESGNCLQILQGHSSYIYGTLIHQDKMISWSADHELRIWDIESGNCLFVLQGHSSDVNGALIHQDKIISWSYDRTLRIWDIKSGNSLHVIQGHSSDIYGALIHQHKIISWSDDRTLRIWDIESGCSLHVLQGHSSDINGALTHQDKMISWSYDRTLRIWDIRSGNSLHVLQGHSSDINGGLIHEEKMISWSFDRTLRIWDIRSGNSLHVLHGHSSYIYGTLIHQDKMISWSADRTLRIWDIESGNSLFVLQGHSSDINGALIHQDKIISWSDDRTLRIWDIRSGSSLHVLQGHLSDINGALIHQDKMISWSYDRTLRIWDIESGNSLHVLQGHSSDIYGALIHQDKMISWSDDRTLRIWDIRLGSSLFVLQGHSSYIYGALIHQDRLISWSYDRTLRIWDMQSGNCLHLLQGHSSDINGALIYQDKVISWSDDGSVVVWGIDNGNIHNKINYGFPVIFAQVQEHLLFVIDVYGKIMIHELKNYSTETSYYADAVITTLHIKKEEQRIIAGDKGGQMHFLQPVGFRL